MSLYDGVNRREFLRVGSLSALGLGLADLLRLRSLAEDGSNRAPARNCILIWLDGGPSHLDTFDLKPNAPSEVRGKYKPIASNVPGLMLCEQFEHLSKVADKLCIVRSVTSELGVHSLGSQYLLTGYKPSPVLEYPSYGSVVAHCQPEKPVLPSYIALSNARLQAGKSLGNGYLPGSTRPFMVEGDPSRPDFRVRDLQTRNGLTRKSLERRREFLNDLDQLSRQIEENPLRQERDGQFEQAYRLILSATAKRAFDMSQETQGVRDRYGRQYNRWTRVGQGCLLARRLVEAGCRFVTVTDPGWDMHGGIYNALDRKLPALDQAVAALLSDLDESGLLEETLVLVMGEFGRTPRLNGNDGRDHWPRAFSVMLAGGGVKTGQVIGKSDPRGTSPIERPVTPTDLARTIYTLLGISPDRKFHTPDGRPVSVASGGQVISECVV
jgi:hypothetical protein